MINVSTDGMSLDTPSFKTDASMDVSLALGVPSLSTGKSRVLPKVNRGSKQILLELPKVLIERIKMYLSANPQYRQGQFHKTVMKQWLDAIRVDYAAEFSPDLYVDFTDSNWKVD